jgi:competence protein ComEA
MTDDKMNKFWLLATGLIILIILASSITIWLRYDKGHSIEIIPSDTIQFKGQICIEGAVTNPGAYPLEAGDSIDRLIHISGGTTNDADLSRIQLFIPWLEEDEQFQKVNINRAEDWLLQALPGIGEVRARAIIDYRQQNGYFLHIEDLTRVPGINASTFEKIRHLITTTE